MLRFNIVLSPVKTKIRKPITESGTAWVTYSNTFKKLWPARVA